MIDYSVITGGILIVGSIIASVYFFDNLVEEKLKITYLVLACLFFILAISVNYDDIKIYQYGEENFLKKELNVQRNLLIPIQQKIDSLEKIKEEIK